MMNKKFSAFGSTQFFFSEGDYFFLFTAFYLQTLCAGNYMKVYHEIYSLTTVAAVLVGQIKIIFNATMMWREHKTASAFIAFCARFQSAAFYDTKLK